MSNDFPESKLVNDYMLVAALREGWCQLGPGIPVFFKYLEPSNEFLIVNTVDPKAYYDIWNVWVETGRIKPDQIDIGNIFNSAYNHYMCTPKYFAKLASIAISDHYYMMRDTEKKRFYDSIVQHLNDKEHVTAKELQGEVCDQPVVDKGLEG